MSELMRQTHLILRNDLRLLWRDVRTGKAKLFTGTVMLVLLLAGLHALSLLFFTHLQTPPLLAVEAAIWAFFAFLMLGSGMNHAISLFFERSDFDLLLASPIAPRAVLLSRLAVMTVSCCLGAGFFLLPLLNGIILGFSANYIFGYAVWFFLTLCVACVGIWITIGLVRWLGARRARIWIQVLAAVLGASIYISFQIQTHLSPGQRHTYLETAAGMLDALGLRGVASAGRGEALPLLLLAVVAVGAATATARLLARAFLTGLQEAVTPVAPKRSREKPIARFSDHALWVTFKKDTRLILRDPLLLSQILPSAMYIAPVFSASTATVSSRF